MRLHCSRPRLAATRLPSPLPPCPLHCRPYTPISHPDEKGHFELAIKVRLMGGGWDLSLGVSGTTCIRLPCGLPSCFLPSCSLHARRPLRAALLQVYPGGKMSQHIEHMKVGWAAGRTGWLLAI